MRPDSRLRLWRYINRSLTYLLMNQGQLRSHVHSKWNSVSPYGVTLDHCNINSERCLRNV